MKEMSLEYILTHYGEEPKNQLGAVTTPIYQTSSYLEGGEFEYSRGNAPNYKVIEEKIAAMHNAKKAVFTSCGIGAIHAVLAATLKAGDHCVVIRSIYPTAKKLLSEMERYNITHTYVRGMEFSEIEKAIQPNTKLIYLESPSSIVMELQDLAEVTKMAKAKGIYTCIDNTCATPLFQRPLDLGVDFVIYSATKYFSGHTDTLGGFVVGNNEELMEAIRHNRILYGYNGTPFNAWLIERGLRTLKVRLLAIQDTAMKMAKYFESHPKITEVNYPALQSHPQHNIFKKQMTGLGGLMSIKTTGTYEENAELLKRCRVFEHASSWGGHESLVYPLGATKPFATEEGSIIYHGGVIRVYVGLEDFDTLCEDMENALKAIK